MPDLMPPNCMFEVDDIEKRWEREHGSFDLIHARGLSGCFKDLRTVIEQSFEHLAPGGYIELKDILLTPKSDDGTLSRGSPLCEWANNLANAARQLGRPLIGNASEYERILIEEGFEVIEVREHKLPTNLWPEDETMKAIGYLTSKTTGQELEAISLARFVHSLGWDVTNALMSCALARKVFQSRAVHAYFPYITVLGKKPEAV